MAAAAISLSIVAAAPAIAAPKAAENYVALGDSYDSGVGTRTYDSSSGDCRRSPAAYAQLWAKANSPASFKFVACSGARTADVQKQADQLSSSTTLVSVSVGGNDIGFASVLTSCQLGSDEDCFAKVNEAVNQGKTTLPAKLDATYSKIKSKAPSAKVVVFNYPRLFDLGTCGLGGLSKAKRERLNQAADTLSGVISGRVAAAGFRLADIRDRFDGHGICSKAEWLNGLSWPINESYHPNTNGHSQGYLAAFTAAL
ncbi:SGNH/GDSL hydrolase family protein [Allokutzneria oryzae]|uniref:SGNH/GDSL hydrolase family protein n=1 Tax=Allokutzneria oryzae TaxID=1378989 RepID=A0ABV6A5C6_9PSEU